MILKIALYALILFACIICIRIIAGPTIWDRLLGLSLLSSKIVMTICLFSIILNKGYLLDVALSYVLLGYISILFIASFIKKQGKI